MKRAAVILARGGSKRLPRKNIRPFFGKPILHYPIAAARASLIVDEVAVSTDDPEIVRLAIEGGCHQVIHRPAELASDTATTAEAMRHAVEWLMRETPELEHVCCIYPCTPLIEPLDLQHGFERLVTSSKCYVFPVTTYEQAPQRMLRMEADGRVQSVWPQFDHMRNQDLDQRWHDGGQWYWGTRDAWLKGIPIYGAWSLGLPLPRWRCIDIDTYDDWLIAEAVYQAKFNERRRAA